MQVLDDDLGSLTTFWQFSVLWHEIFTLLVGKRLLESTKASACGTCMESILFTEIKMIKVIK